MRTLHHYPGNASLTPHIVLEELGEPYALALVDRAQGAHKSPEYLKLNPNGLIPVLVDGELVLYETAAICLHLADTHPAAALAPPLGTPQRAHFYKWLAWLTNSMQATLIHYFYPERMVDAGNADGAAQVKSRAAAKVGALLDILDAQLASHDGDWLLDSGYSVCDPYALMLCRWTRGFAQRPARSRAHIAPYLERMLARDAVRRVFAQERLGEPLV